jgi:hypothetical protein
MKRQLEACQRIDRPQVGRDDPAHIAVDLAVGERRVVA